MLSFFDPLRELNIYSVFVRIFLAVVCGGCIGMERELRRRPAGFRTHILICLGAAMTTLTGQFVTLYMHYYTDATRLGAQVIAGIGFMGAGCIIVTRRQRVKGLTTAAGLWGAAIIGLAIGAGFFEGAFLTAFFIMLAEMVFVKLEYRIQRTAREASIYLEYRDKSCLEDILTIIQENSAKILNMEITRPNSSNSDRICAIFTLKLQKQMGLKKIMDEILLNEAVELVEEL